MASRDDISDFPFGMPNKPSKELALPEAAGPKAVFNLWREKKGDREFPLKSDLHPSLMARYLPYIYIVDILDGGKDYRIRLLGSSVADMLGKDYTGTLLSETPEELDWRGEIYGLCMKRRAPVFYLFELAPFGRETVVTENALFPLSDGDGNLAHLLCMSVEVGRTYEASR
ncbi:PAS domain-containing protein [Kordiimonas lipolytica]|uniref:PAS domain-containing protein n=1 Tax=Kordiimonas lipolytica TaxID=1662421 RepID=A0ABV8U8E6_9PROT|nr:PAS domain-containing protein [Kordiimonas lipolytica]